MIRYLYASGLALVMVAGLFWTMNFMIQDSTSHSVYEHYKAVAVVPLPAQAQVPLREYSGPEPPKLPDEPLRPPQLQVPESMQIAPQQLESPITFDMPKLNVPVTLVGTLKPALGELAGATPTIGDASTELIPLVRPAPQYPSQAARARISGWVKLRITVNPNGSVQDARVMESDPRGMFEEAAVTSARRSKFRPRIENGAAVESSGEYTIKFQLDDGV